MLGCGEWKAFITERGGGSFVYEVPFESLQAERVLNQSGSLSVNLAINGPARSNCCEVLRETEPYVHELAFFRSSSNEPAFVGPITDIRGTTISGQDGYLWPSKRFIEEDQYWQDDGAHVFKAVIEYAMNLENSAGIQVEAKACGHETTVRVQGDEKPRATDVVSPIVTSMVDFTVVGRRILAGGLEGFFPDIPTLHDQGVVTATANKIGTNFATDVAVIGGQPERFPQPVSGRATRGSSRYGLVQESFVELLLQTNEDCDASALARLNAQQPLPMNVNVRYSPNAAVLFENLMAGMKFDVRLSEVSGCIEVAQVMRQQKVSVKVDSNGEEIDGELVPQSLIDASFIGGG